MNRSMRIGVLLATVSTIAVVGLYAHYRPPDEQVQWQRLQGLNEEQVQLVLGEPVDVIRIELDTMDDEEKLHAFGVPPSSIRFHRRVVLSYGHVGMGGPADVFLEDDRVCKLRYTGKPSRREFRSQP